ncbi:MAG: serine/threonine protein kinase/WD40 repeat protein [Verrucomicrobiales bacterium]|jgi:serine/threonine protein kinase/WD40 repeat protein
MKEQQQHREEEIFIQALEIEAGTAREAYLDTACGGEKNLREKVGKLVAAHEEPAAILGALGGVGAPAGERAGDQIGSYELLKELGAGGMGTVWLAQQSEPVVRKVALKIIKLGMDTKEVGARFEAERQALAMMDHPGIASVYDAGSTEQGRPYFVMELVEGQPLIEFCDERRLGTADRLRLFIKVCRAVQHAHQKGVVHRDLKPSNILVTERDGRPAAKVIDFGVAKAVENRLTEQTFMTGVGRVIGTLGYMSPEQAGGKMDIDTRSDIYSLGVVLYELLSGATPIGAERLREATFDVAIKMIREEDPPKPSTQVSQLGETAAEVAAQRSTEIRKLARTMSGDLDWIVMKALEKDRTRRYETVNGLAADIKRHLANEPVVARPPSTAYRLQKAWKRNKLVWTAAVAVVAALVAGIAVSKWQANVAVSARANALLNLNKATRAEAQLKSALTIANTEKERATKNAEVASLNLYTADMNLVHRALLDGDLGKARQLLGHYQNLEQDILGFEYYLFLEQAKGDQSHTIEGFDAMVNSIILFPDDSGRFVAATLDGRVTIHHIDLGVAPTELAPRRRVTPARRHQLAVSPDSTILATVREKGIVLWDTADWSRIAGADPLSFDSPSCSSLCFSPSGKWFAARQKGSIRLWDTTDWSIFGDIPIPINTRPFGRTLDFIDDSRIAAAVGNWVEVWGIDPNSKRLDQNWESPPINRGAGALVSDGRFLAAISGPIRRGSFVEFKVWDLASEPPEEIASQDDAHRNFGFDLRLSSDGKRIFSAGGDQAIKVWSFPELELIDTFLGHGNEVWALGFSGDGKTLVSGGKDATVRLWSLDRAEAPEALPDLPEEEYFSEDGRLVIAPRDEEHTVRDAATGELLSRFETEGELIGFGGRDSLLFSKWTAETGNLVIGRVEIGSGEFHPLTTLEDLRRPSVDSVVASASGNRIAIELEGRYEIWDLEADRKVQEIPLAGDQRRVLALSDRGDTLLAWTAKVSPDVGRASVAVWDVASGRLRQQFNLSTLGLKWRVNVSPQGNMLAGDNFANNSMRLVDLESGSLVGELTGHMSHISNFVFSPDGRTLITRNRSTTRLWNVATQREIARFAHDEKYPSPRISIKGRVLGRNLGNNKEFWRVERPRLLLGNCISDSAFLGAS